MERELISNLPRKVGDSVRLCGWVETIRNQKRMQFLVLRDHTGKAQVVHEKGGAEDAITEVINQLTGESAVIIEGKVVHNEHVKLNQLEVVITNIVTTSHAEGILPLDEKSTLDVRLDNRFLDLRRPENYLIFRIQTTIEHAMREFWDQNGFLEIHSPKIMGSPSESGAELFRVEYFGKTVYLAQSPQFYKQMAMAAGFDRVFEIGPVFRANPSFTSRHDTEFTSVDVEISWINSHDDVMKLEETWINYVMGRVKEKHGDAIRLTYGQEVIVPTIPFPRFTVVEAHEILAGKYGHGRYGADGDLDPEGERLMAQHVHERFGHDWVFIKDYPVEARPFYHMRHESDPKRTKSFDLLFKGLEVTSGAQREHRYDVLAQQVDEKGMRRELVQYYLDFFRYGCPPHGGYGFGLTRMLMLLLGLKNVREVTYLYRGPNRVSP